MIWPDNYAKQKSCWSRKWVLRIRLINQGFLKILKKKSPPKTSKPSPNNPCSPSPPKPTPTTTSTPSTQKTPSSKRPKNKSSLATSKPYNKPNNNTLYKTPSTNPPYSKTPNKTSTSTNTEPLVRRRWIRRVGIRIVLGRCIIGCWAILKSLKRSSRSLSRWWVRRLGRGGLWRVRIQRLL